MKEKFFWRMLGGVRKILRGQGSNAWTIPVLFSVVLHTILVIGLFMIMPSSEERTINPTPSFVSARMVTLEPEAKPKAKPKPARKVAPKPKPVKAAPVKKAPPKPKVDKKSIALKRRQETERKQQEREKLRKEQERLDELQKQREQEMLAALAREQQARMQAEQLKGDQVAVATYAGVIKNLVESLWSRPASAKRGMKATFRIKMLPTGEVISISMISSSGNGAFDRSALQAIEKAQPFREIQHLESRLFDRDFREFRFVFDPRDLLK
ncbi:cell envelope integrity protein TolA [Parendozoicomonas sp. Alg238-R29]|uniref:cell envelope integrity protein TolA n=1 Tax=Parendozoicomonas sp. Alg238-R29 TaxID=2993446 RepID=UPI00248D5070|nr:cell envelope integrity protein TolA [Parendozoicomonas sp. Alg238-R29]